MAKISFDGVEALILVAALAVALLAGCDSASEDAPVRMQFDAEVQLLVLDGPPSYILNRLGTNDSYYPLNLPAAFQEETKRVRVDGWVIRDYRVFLMRPIEIISIEELPDSGE